LASEHRSYFSSGTTALYAALVSLGIKRSFVAVPPNICPNIIVAIFASSNRPYFVEIEFERFGISPYHLESAINKVSAVIAVHAYGIPCLIDKLAALSKKHGIPLIEDCAQAEGATYGGRQVGVFGDVAIFSYGVGKILALNGGGGMAITRRRDVAHRLQGVQERLPIAEKMEGTVELSRFFKFLYNQCYPDQLALYRAAAARFFRSVGKSMLAAHRPGLGQEIKSAQSCLPAKIASRRKNAEIYSHELSGQPEIKVCLFPEGAVPWRFNLRLEHTLRQQVLRTLLSEGFNVSSWYPDMRRFLDKPSYASGPAPHAVDLDETILNFWLDDGTTENDITITTRRLKQAVHDFDKQSN